MLVVIDYNVGNVKSVCNVLRHIGCEVRLTAEPAVVKEASGVVLPGVAAFGYAVKALGPLAELIRQCALGGTPLLGICVGYQMLFDQSNEYGQHKGLGLIDGRVVALPGDLAVPHMGWNQVEFNKDTELLAGLGEAKHFYFAHSYYARVDDSKARIAYTHYGFDLPALVEKKNIYGTQFHPEKSGKAGLQVLRNFVRICHRCCEDADTKNHSLS